MKKILSKRMLILLLAMSLSFAITGCMDDSLVGEQFVADESSDNNGVSSGNSSYEALFYTNNGDLYSTVEGKSFTFTPNKVKEYGYNSEGRWESYYTTSSVMSVQIDGSYIESCGNTIIFKDKSIVYTQIEDIMDNLDMSVENKEENDNLSSNLRYYYNLRYWWSDIKEKGQGGAKVVIIQSQNGDNIGILSGNDVTWRVSEDLPKTTVLTIDGKDVLIHRANFQVIDAKLLENN